VAVSKSAKTMHLELLLPLFLTFSCASNRPDSAQKQTSAVVDVPSTKAGTMATAGRRDVVVDCNFERFKPLRVGSDWSRGIVRRVEPTYPPEAKRRSIAGTVIVRILIHETGEVQQVCSRGPKLLRPAAERAAFDWLFDTPLLNGKKVPYILAQLTFNFVLAEPGASSESK